MEVMKKILGLVLLFGMLGLFTSCDEENDIIGVVYFPVIVTQTVQNAVNYQTNGLEFMIYASALVANESIDAPKEVYDYSSSVSNTWVNGWSKVSYMYAGTVQSDSIKFDSDLSGEYETYLMKSDDKVVNNWMMSDITNDSDYYTLSGTTTRTGMQYSKVYEDNFESTIEQTFENLVVNRITGQIKSGTINFTYVGTSSYGANFNNFGQVVYGDYSSVIIIE